MEVETIIWLSSFLSI